MKFEYILEICLALIASIIGIAYPIMIDKISRIGERYQSINLQTLFEKEFPQRPIYKCKKNPRIRITWFFATIIASLISLLFVILDINPLFGWNNGFINNSGLIALLFISAVLSVFFFIWLFKIMLYSGDLKNLFMYIQKQYRKNNLDQNLNYYLKTLNELSLFSFKNNISHMEETIEKFYSDEISSLVNEHKDSKGVVFPSEIYQIIHDITKESSRNKNNDLGKIRYRAISGFWMLGGNARRLKISQQSYNELWSNIILIYDNQSFIEEYWGVAFQYYNYSLHIIFPETEINPFRITNEEAIKIREIERKHFRFFNYSLCGLLLYKKIYEPLPYILSFSQSWPPEYVLFPKTFSELFEDYLNYVDDYRNAFDPDRFQFYYPGLDNLGNEQLINKFICEYLTLLYIHLHLNNYRLPKTKMDFPNTNDKKIYKLKNWISYISGFKQSLTTLMSNAELMKQIGYGKFIEEQRNFIITHIDNFEKEIRDTILYKKKYDTLSEVKTTQFYTKTEELISQPFNYYKKIFNVQNEVLKPDTKNKLTEIRGIVTKMSKSDFTDSDLPVSGYDTILGGHIAQVFYRRVSDSFMSVASRQYLFNASEIKDVFEKLNCVDSNYIVVCSDRLNTDIEQTLSSLNIEVLKILQSGFIYPDIMFVLHINHLPSLYDIGLPENETEKNPIGQFSSSKFNLKIALQEAKDDASTDIDENYDPMLDIYIGCKFILEWANDAEVVRLNIVSKYIEQGVPNSIQDIIPFKKIFDRND